MPHARRLSLRAGRLDQPPLPRNCRRTLRGWSSSCPTAEEIRTVPDGIIQANRDRIVIDLPPTDTEWLLKAAVGLTLHEAENALGAVHGGGRPAGRVGRGDGAGGEAADHPQIRDPVVHLQRPGHAGRGRAGQPEALAGQAERGLDGQGAARAQGRAHRPHRARRSPLPPPFSGPAPFGGARPFEDEADRPQPPAPPPPPRRPGRQVDY
jgi:hypothetical protein